MSDSFDLNWDPPLGPGELTPPMGTPFDPNEVIAGAFVQPGRRCYLCDLQFDPERALTLKPYLTVCEWCRPYLRSPL